MGLPLDCRYLPRVWWVLVLFIALAPGCMKVGPDFVRPDAKVLNQWLEVDETRLRAAPADYKEWWKGFNDPILDKLVRMAYEQNLPLRVAGVRVFEARARLGIAIGEEYPQVQQAFGDAAHIRESERAPTAPSSPRVSISIIARPRWAPRQAGSSTSGASSGVPSSPLMRASLAP